MTFPPWPLQSFSGFKRVWQPIKDSNQPCGIALAVAFGRSETAQGCRSGRLENHGNAGSLHRKGRQEAKVLSPRAKGTKQLDSGGV